MNTVRLVGGAGIDTRCQTEWVPFAMFFSRHQAVLYSADFDRRGYNGASHGCVNVRNWDALAQLFSEARVGDKVVVYRS